MPPNGPEIKLLAQSPQLTIALVDLPALAEFLAIEGKRAVEKAAARFVVQRVLCNASLEINYEPSGRPYLDGGPGISISHAFDKLAVAFSPQGTCPGIDIEKVRDKIFSIREKYLSEAELEALRDKTALEHTLYWAVKETLYKASGLSGLIFAAELLVEPFTVGANNNLARARVARAGAEKNYTLRYHLIDDYVLVYTCEQ